MKYRGHDAARDANEPAIVAGLRAIGATVVLLNRPVDLLVGYRRRTTLLEVKLPLGPRGGSSASELTNAQEEFFQTWEGGSVQVVRSLEEALRAVGAISPEERIRNARA